MLQVVICLNLSRPNLLDQSFDSLQSQCELRPHLLTATGYQQVSEQLRTRMCDLISLTNQKKKPVDQVVMVQYFEAQVLGILCHDHHQVNQSLLHICIRPTASHHLCHSSYELSLIEYSDQLVRLLELPILSNFANNLQTQTGNIWIPMLTQYDQMLNKACRYELVHNGLWLSRNSLHLMQ